MSDDAVDPFEIITKVVDDEDRVDTSDAGNDLSIALLPSGEVQISGQLEGDPTYSQTFPRLAGFPDDVAMGYMLEPNGGVSVIPIPRTPGARFVKIVNSEWLPPAEDPEE